MIIALFAAAHAALPACELSAEADTLRHLKQELWPRAYREADDELLQTILAPQFQMVDHDGSVSTRAQEIAYVAAKKPDPSTRSFTYRIDRLEVFPNCTAIVSGTGLVKDIDAQGRPVASTYTSSNILIKGGGVWQAVASHVSGVKKITPEAP